MMKMESKGVVVELFARLGILGEQSNLMELHSVSHQVSTSVSHSGRWSMSNAALGPLSLLLGGLFEWCRSGHSLIGVADGIMDCVGWMSRVGWRRRFTDAYWWLEAGQFRTYRWRSWALTALS